MHLSPQHHPCYSLQAHVLPFLPFLPVLPVRFFLPCLHVCCRLPPRSHATTPQRPRCCPPSRLLPSSRLHLRAVSSFFFAPLPWPTRGGMAPEKKKNGDTHTRYSSVSISVSVSTSIIRVSPTNLFIYFTVIFQTLCSLFSHSFLSPCSPCSL